MKRPSISVIVVTHDAEDHVMRTLESVLAQDFSDVQLIIADAASHDRTASVCRKVADRDIRLDVLQLDQDDRALAFDKAVEAARGRAVLVLEQDDWLAPKALDYVTAALEDANLQLAILALSIDEDGSNGERSSCRLSFDVPLASTSDAFRDQAGAYLAGGAFRSLRGKVLDRGRIDELGLRMKLCGGAVPYLAAYLENVERVGMVSQAVCHTKRPSFSEMFDMSGYERCERDHKRLLELVGAWHREHDDALVKAVHRLHVHEVIACIEGACAMRGVSVIERNDRVRDIVEAPSTRQSVAVLDDAGREFGFMYGSIARRNVTACCLGARLLQFARISRLPLGSHSDLLMDCA